MENQELRHGLVAEYLFNGNAMDSSGNSHHGKVEGAALTSDRFGNPDSAYLFDGKDDFIVIEPAPKLSKGAFSLSVWVRYGSGASLSGWNNAIVSQDGHDHRRVFQLSTYDDRIRWHRFLCPNPEVEMPVPMQKDAWTHVVAVFDGISHSLYCNGVWMEEQRGVFEPNDEEPLYIGRKSTDEPCFFFNGAIDGLRMYNRVLTKDEIVCLYQENHWEGDKDSHYGLEEASLKGRAGSQTKLVHTAADCFGINLDSLVPITYKLYEGMSNGHPCILKLNEERIATLDESHGEADALNHWAACGVRVAVPRRSRNGSYAEPVTVASIPARNIAMVYEKVQGNRLDYDLQQERIEAWGEAVGRMHAAAKSYKPSNPAWKRYEWHESPFLQFAALLPASADKLLSECEAFIARLKKLPADTDNYGLIHGDLHRHNVLVNDDGEITLIDFEEMEYNWFAADIAELVYNECYHFDVPKKERNHFAERFLRSFLRGYYRENRLAPEAFAPFHDFLRLRALFLLGWNVQWYSEKGFEKFRVRLAEQWTPLDVDVRQLIAYAEELHNNK